MRLSLIAVFLMGAAARARAACNDIARRFGKDSRIRSSQRPGNPHESSRDFRERTDWPGKFGAAPGRN
ncbi:MAG: hypothetical protein LBF50_10560 [Azoarcus sp.]|nr:hypothetical protein [Azoarcus sp.]